MQHSALDCELSGHRKATRLLSHHGKCRHSKSGQKRTGKLRITHDISKRPEEASSRSQIGDWEGDTVAGRRLPYHPGGSPERIPCRRQGGQGQRSHEEGVCRRGRADRHARQGQGVLRCRRGCRRRWGLPYTSAIPTISERGTNENTNGLLRDWFSKGKSLDDVDDRKVQEVYDSLN